MFPFPFTITSEAASDIVNHCFNNPDRKFHRAEITNGQDHGTCLKLYFTVPSLEAIGESYDHLYIEMPLAHVMNLLHFAMKTINHSNELTGQD